jgi:hypothetical protein
MYATTPKPIIIHPNFVRNNGLMMGQNAIIMPIDGIPPPPPELALLSSTLELCLSSSHFIKQPFYV